jgi:CRP/FNR family transcriptional regulator
LLYAPRVAGAPVELIRGIPLFSDLDGRELDAVASSMKARTFEAGRTVVEEGTTGVGFFVIESGTATVTVDGRPVRTLGSGDHFGELALIGNVGRTASVVADTELRCFGMSFWDFRPLVESNASIAWKLLEAMARRLSGASA